MNCSVLLYASDWRSPNYFGEMRETDELRENSLMLPVLLFRPTNKNHLEADKI